MCGELRMLNRTTTAYSPTCVTSNQLNNRPLIHTINVSREAMHLPTQMNQHSLYWRGAKRHEKYLYG